MGSIKPIQGVQKRAILSSKCHKLYEDPAVTAGQIPKPSGIGSRELLISARLRLADQNTS